MASIIHHLGEPNNARTIDGVQVERRELLWVPEFLALVKVAHYDNHFIYATNKVGSSAYMCTCGAPAVVVPNSYLGTFVCMNHHTYGYHVGSDNRRWQ